MKRKPTSVPAEKIKQLENIRDSIGVHIDDWTQICTCMAWYRFTDDYGFLRSYNTIVAIYDKKDNTTYVFGRYSRTTYQHVGKFRRIVCNKFRTSDKSENLELVDWFER